MSNQIPGVPEGWELVRVGMVHHGEWRLMDDKSIRQWLTTEPSVGWAVVLRKIEKPAKYRPFESAEEFKPHRDRWICRLYDGRPDAKGCYKVSAYDDRGTFANDGKTSYQDMLEEGRVFDNGTPFGVRIDE